MPSFAGVNIFGTAIKIRTSDNPRVSQENHFFGVSGVESLDGGLQGRFTEAVGVLYADSAAGLANLLALFRSFNDGNAYVLVDSFNDAWPYVKLISFEPDPDGIKQTTYNEYFVRYRATFKHLV